MGIFLLYKNKDKIFGISTTKEIFLKNKFLILNNELAYIIDEKYLK